MNPKHMSDQAVLPQRELTARLQREAAHAAERAEAELGAAAARAEAAQRGLEAAEARAGALEAQLASRATPTQARPLSAKLYLPMVRVFGILSSLAPLACGNDN